MPKLENKRINLQEAKRTSQFYDGKKDIAKLGAGDSYYVVNFLKKERIEIFDKIMTEVTFAQMFNIGENNADPIPRLVSAQSDHQDSGASAIYRMPGCNEKNIATTEWTPTVRYVCDQASKAIGQQLNHCVLTLFRNEDDSLAFHKDKLIDLQENSLILSVSFGETRPILFHSMDGKDRQTIMLRPGSLLAIGPKTNKTYMHGIPKLIDHMGPRVSLSLRTIETFIKFEESKDSNNDPIKFQILGKGAEFQCANYPFTKSHDDTDAYNDNVKTQIHKHLGIANK